MSLFLSNAADAGIPHRRHVDCWAHAAPRAWPTQSKPASFADGQSRAAACCVQHAARCTLHLAAMARNNLADLGRSPGFAPRQLCTKAYARSPLPASGGGAPVRRCSFLAIRFSVSGDGRAAYF
ncbi:hypothetical protein PICMEDRAFT_142558 [Pichia membranifaciens NRRL Y-2026]|uniref:Uncharacterized protein n=1 Tax=Pichia membranifaciens NRRL Y-2026 TaxID=763406 RepID=A0A1E3NJ65_9ASCO|nr:hypothetical protein PICMEDRAFT_142558 [Pichia membranifaciens NRRL Y-2026]ODQ45618.1 hypothetical protein PICMEDRAFT_142558 [Pichia membranifaciens NRRL Y-2026]